MNKPLLFFLGYIFLVNNIFPMNQSPAQEQFTVANLVALQKSDPAAGASGLIQPAGECQTARMRCLPAWPAAPA